MGASAALARRAFVALALLLVPAALAEATPVWQTLPPTPTRPPAAAQGMAPVTGVEIYYVPGAQLVILPGVSHFAMLQNPAEFNAAVLKFLAG